jgi:metal-responsive CopG/Arc/MetJ family transcriptional regulator
MQWQRRQREQRRQQSELTPTARSELDKIAKADKRSRSFLVQQICRGMVAESRGGGEDRKARQMTAAF